MTRAVFMVSAGMALLSAACARSLPLPAVRSSAAAAEDTAVRHLLRPLPVPQPIRAAIRNGTRTATGQPGPRYWQQSVSYRIEAELDPATALLAGRERIVYRNRSPETISSIVLNLYQNVYAEGVPRNRYVTITGGVTLERVAAQGETLARFPPSRIAVRGAPRKNSPAGYAVEGTLARLLLPRPVVPGDSAVLEVAWRHTVPRAPSFRTAYERSRQGAVFQVAQWYPQVATFDDLRGWDATPYLGDGEFYLEYGDFDVSLTVPSGWLVGATGVLQNPGEVLTPEAQQRLAAGMRSDTALRIVTEADLSSGRATRRGGSGKLTWRFRAADVRDFAFTTSDHYLWDVVPAAVPLEGGGTRSVPVHSLHRPGAPAWDQAAAYGKHVVEFFSRLLLSYPYPQITIAEGPVGGIEYPQVVFVGGYDTAKDLHSGIAHEVGHQWFPMIVGHDEAAYAWMDEGLITFYEMLARSDLFPGDDLFAWDHNYYLSVAGKESEVPIMRHTDQVSPYGARYVAAYSKPAILFRALNGIVGEETFRRAVNTYAGEWLFRHPTPWDFFSTLERVSGRDLSWFFYPWWWETGTLDLAVGTVETVPGGGVQVTVRDLGEIPAPVRLVVTTADGEAVRAEIPIESWIADRRRTVTVTVPVKGLPVRVEVDPERLLPDSDRKNNTWSAAAAAP